MNLTASIESAELRFRQILEDYFVSIYDENNLYSHGLGHHRRVWQYCRELLNVPLSHSGLIPSCDPSKLIIASYLHDIGMSVDPGPRHGKHSRNLCRQFLQNNGLNENLYSDVLDVIEDHDNKDYITEGVSNDLLTLLSVADDLDAFGYTGIYRYSEIYLIRGINPRDLGYLILENAKKRAENCVKVFGTGSYFKNHLKRYDVLGNFFIQYNIQAASYDFTSASIRGYCGVIQLFMLMIRNKMPVEDLFAEAEIYNNDFIITSFLKGLKSELATANRKGDKVFL